jgi:hypothetical protein
MPGLVYILLKGVLFGKAEQYDSDRVCMQAH